MSERTVITTVEITKIYKDIPEECTAGIEIRKNVIKDALGADDVVVTNVQEFVLGDEE